MVRISDRLIPGETSRRAIPRGVAAIPAVRARVPVSLRNTRRAVCARQRLPATVQNRRIGQPSHFGRSGAQRVCPKETRWLFQVFQ